MRCVHKAFVGACGGQRDDSLIPMHPAIKCIEPDAYAISWAGQDESCRSGAENEQPEDIRIAALADAEQGGLAPWFFGVF
jgi:hypothetical protein